MTMSDQDVHDLLSSPIDAVLSYPVGNDRVMGTPIWFMWVDGVVRFQSPTTSVKSRVLRRTGRASLCVHEQELPRNRYVTVEGPVTEVPFDLERDIGAAAVHYLGAAAPAFVTGIEAALDAGRQWASFELHPERTISRSMMLG